MHGCGQIRFANGAVYTGEFLYDLLDGDGEYQYADGSVYSGQFKEGLQHGFGILLDKHGETELFGYWTDGDFTGDDQPEAWPDPGEIKILGVMPQKELDLDKVDEEDSEDEEIVGIK